MDAIGTSGIGSTDPALAGGSAPGARTSPTSSSPAAASTPSGDSYSSEQGQGAAATEGGYDRRGRPAAKAGQLSAAQQRQVQRLQARDAEVKAHEAAHQAAGGGMVGAASFTYQKGPDGRSYAIGGEVSINAGSERTPAATISKMQQVIAAATAPAQPSGQDLAVAAQAQAAMAKAQSQVAQGGAGAEGTAVAAPVGGAPAPAQDPTGGIATRPDDETEAQDDGIEESAEADATAATATTTTATAPKQAKAEPLPVWAVKAPAAKTASMADAETQPAKTASAAGPQPVSGAAGTDSASTATDTSNTASAGGLPSDLFGDRSPGRLRRSVEVDELYRRLARGEVAGTVLDRKA
jgi:hypothetical protein